MLVPVVCRRMLPLFIVQLLTIPTAGMAMSTSASPSCAVIGCGVLGTSFCQQILSSPDFHGWTVTGITKTGNNHESILNAVGKNERFHVSTMDDCPPGQKFDNVVFCAPPSGFSDYAGAVEGAVKNVWAGASGGGTFVFTSSGGIMGEGNDGAVVNEDTPAADPKIAPRVERLVKAEEAVRQNGGCCLRLAGLYNLNRGAHSFWLNSGKDVSGRADGIINLLHYDDAASACIAALKVGSTVVKGRTFLISDRQPLTRQEICASAMKAKPFQDKKMPMFLGGGSDPKGKIYDGSVSDAALKWKPKYASFDEFMSSHA